MSTVPYHHPENRQFSLAHVNDDSQATFSRIVEYSGEVKLIVEQYSFDEGFYVIYTNKGGGEPMENILHDVEFSDPNNGRIVTRILEICQNISDENREQENEPIQRYKESEIDSLPSALDRVSWGEPAPVVAGQLASNIILEHALPNGNHRTAISMLELYLSEINPEFTMPETVDEDYDWRDWVNEYIIESKTLLTVRRKNVPLKCLREFGVDQVERWNGITIDLSEYQLDMYPSDAKRLYAKKHEELWRDFAEEVLNRADMSELKESEGPSKRDFARGLD